MLQCLNGMVNKVQQSIRVLKQNKLLLGLSNEKASHQDYFENMGIQNFRKDENQKQKYIRAVEWCMNV